MPKKNVLQPRTSRTGDAQAEPEAKGEGSTVWVVLRTVPFTVYRQFVKVCSSQEKAFVECDKWNDVDDGHFIEETVLE
jgi:hypothetical protein